RHAAYERSRIEMMRGYAETAACRRVFVLSYFGEEPSEASCRHCDNAVRGAEHDWVQENGDEPAVPMPFAVGDRVLHEEWGEGLVNRLEDDSITILFDDVGYKTLANALVLQNDLLRPAP